jgi:hypothetical protein
MAVQRRPVRLTPSVPPLADALSKHQFGESSRMPRESRGPLPMEPQAERRFQRTRQPLQYHRQKMFRIIYGWFERSSDFGMNEFAIPFQRSLSLGSGPYTEH